MVDLHVPPASLAMLAVNMMFIFSRLARAPDMLSAILGNEANSYVSYSSYMGIPHMGGSDYKAGPTFGVAVVAWLLGTVGAIVALALRARATTDQDGPFMKYLPDATGGATSGTPAGPPGAPAVGTV